MRDSNYQPYFFNTDNHFGSVQSCNSDSEALAHFRGSKINLPDHQGPFLHMNIVNMLFPN